MNGTRSAEGGMAKFRDRFFALSEKFHADAIDSEGTAYLLNYGRLPTIALRRLEMTRLVVSKAIAESGSSLKMYTVHFSFGPASFL